MPEVTNPHSVALQVGNGPVVEPGESVELSDDDAAALGWPVSRAKGRKADAPTFSEPSADPEPDESGEHEEIQL